MKSALIAVALSLCLLLSAKRGVEAAEVQIFYAPADNLERIDVDLLRKAQKSIDFAAFILSDWVIADALADAKRRGVKVRVVLDGSQDHVLDRLADLGDAVHVKTTKPIMHLKSYLVDGRILRWGSANFSASGLKKQDNDLSISTDPDHSRRFSVRFEEIYGRAEPLRGR